MAIKPARLPDLGEGVTEGEIIKIKAAPGDFVSLDQPLVEVMTDKASMEIPAAAEGVVEEVKVKEGDMVPVGGVILTLKTEGESSKEAPAKEEGSKPPAEREKPPQAGSQKSGRGAAGSGGPSKESRPAGPSGAAGKSPLALPATRQLAKEFGVRLESVAPSGEKGEIKREDLIRHIKSAFKAAAPQAPADSSPEEELRREPLKGVRRIMFDTMALSKSTIPHFTIVETARMDRLIKIRSGLNASLAKRAAETNARQGRTQGGQPAAKTGESKSPKITYLPFFMKAAVSGLKKFPLFNSFFDPKTREVVYRKAFHLGFAADTPKGLMVPALKNADSKNLLEIAGEIQSLAGQAREGRIQREDLKGASITLTNLGSIGGLLGTPVINPPETAILGIYRIFRQPGQNEAGEWEERAFINFSITCDHRLIDGAEAARFLRHFVRLVEDPGLLLLE